MSPKRPGTLRPISVAVKAVIEPVYHYQSDERLANLGSYELPVALNLID
ncbi:MAG: hypothetical protein ACK5GN_08325 [Pseudomonadota bacterium]|jgi:hypothetical protein